MTAIDPDVQAVLEQVDANSTSALALGLALLRGLQDRIWALTCEVFTFGFDLRGCGLLSFPPTG